VSEKHNPIIYTLLLLLLLLVEVVVVVVLVVVVVVVVVVLVVMVNHKQGNELCACMIQCRFFFVLFKDFLTVYEVC